MSEQLLYWEIALLYWHIYLFLPKNGLQYQNTVMCLRKHNCKNYYIIIIDW